MTNRYRPSMDALVEAVWGERPPVTCEKQIRNAISDLRRVLGSSGSSILPTADGYQLNVAGARFDMHDFHHDVSLGRRYLAAGHNSEAVITFRRALARWYGPVLAGIDSPALQARFEGLQEERLSVFETYIDLELGLGNAASLVQELSQWVADNPFRERLAAQLITALHLSGSRDRALAAYDRTRRTLANALGLDPGSELQDLHRRMLTDNAAPRVNALDVGLGRSNLPPDLKEFTGRIDALSQLSRHAQRASRHGGVNPTGDTLVIDGMPGVGKTALAVHLAHQLADDFPDGQYLLDLHDHSVERPPLDTRAALGMLLRMSRVPPAAIPNTVEEMSQLWRQRLAGRKVLLILDDAASTHRIEPLLASSAGCLTLVTSRRRLALLPSTGVYSLDVFSMSDAQVLFQRLTADREGTYEPHHVDAILEYCGRLPLAVNIAAARLRHRQVWSVAYFAARLADPRRRLLELMTEGGGVAEFFDVSYRQLTTDQQCLLSLLSRLPSHHVEAQAVVAFSGLPIDRVEPLLESLVDEHLLEQPSAGRYRMHELLKIFCMGKTALLDRNEAS
ncbi:MAG: BTAD domain-containing putative transcriptional regulator [Jatrophihabitantaceae bacterium]